MKKYIRISLLILATLVSLFFGSGITHATYSKIPCVVTPNYTTNRFTANNDRGPADLIAIYLRLKLSILKEPRYSTNELEDAIIDIRNHYCARTGEEITNVPEVAQAIAPYVPTITSFTASPTSITSGQSSTLIWTSTNADKCTINGADKATSGTMTASPTTTTTYTLICSKGTVNSALRTVTITVSTTNTTPEITSFTASPTSITSGQSSTLSWTSTNAETCIMDNGVGTVQANATRVVFPTTTTTYTLICSKGTVSSSLKAVTITVGGISNIPCVVTPNYTTNRFTANNDRGPADLIAIYLRNYIGIILQQSQYSETSWYKETQDSIIDTRNHYCARTGEEITNVPEVAQAIVTYLLKITSFTASPTSITSGQSSTLIWTSTNADKCTINGADKASNGSMTVSPTTTTTYTLICSKGTISSAPRMVIINVNTVTLTPPSPPTPTVATFSASPTTINPGQSSTLSWTSNTTGCIINANGVNRTPDGTLLVFPTITTQYSIVCSRGGDFSEPKYVTVTVNNSVSNNQSSTLSELTKSRLNTWITKNVVSKSTTLTTANYIKFIETVISKLNIIKSNTPSSNKNKINTINYLVTELGKILNTLDDNSFLDSILN